MRRIALVALLAMAFTAAIPKAQAQFCPGVSPWVFDDVLASDPFCGYITWMADNGITLGCQIINAGHRLYCPNDTVKRNQMAAFMNRLGNIRVEAVDTGPGLLGGPITTTGTITLAATQLLPTAACTNNQIPRWNGSAWACGNDVNSGGTVTSVGSGTGLAGGPITTSGSLAIATSYQLPQGCTNNQVAKSNGAGAWACANDNVGGGGGTVTSITAGNGLTGGTITTSGTIAVDPTSTTLTSNFFKRGGNAFGATAVLGTVDDQMLDIRVNNVRVMRYQPDATSPNILGGHANNQVGAGQTGQTVGGGGLAGTNCAEPTTGTYTRHCGNRALYDHATVGGGFGNVAHGEATVGGGVSNTASGAQSTIAGGLYNVAGDLSAVGGGRKNVASGRSSTVPGGDYNTAAGDYSVAMGRRASAIGDGSFVFADGNDFDYSSAVPNGFRVRATGGVRFVVDIDVNGNVTWSCLLTAGSGWSCSSDRNLKQNLRVLDGRAVLDKLASMPVYAWNPKGRNAHVLHYGPTAQDFHAAFGLGDTDLAIGQQDADGVALAAIQGLNEKIEAQAREIAELRRIVEVLVPR